MEAAERSVVMSLANNYLYEVSNEVLGIFRTNAMTLSPAEAALFPWVCRANHSCHPNCNYYHDPATGHQRLYCAAPVTRGQVGSQHRVLVQCNKKSYKRTFAKFEDV